MEKHGLHSQTHVKQMKINLLKKLRKDCNYKVCSPFYIYYHYRKEKFYLPSMYHIMVILHQFHSLFKSILFIELNLEHTVFIFPVVQNPNIFNTDIVACHNGS